MAAALLGSPVCAEVMGDTAATVNGEPVLRSEYDKTVSEMEAQYNRAMPGMLANENAKKELQKKVLDQMIDDMVVVQAAEKAKTKVHERDIDAELQKYRSQFMTDENGSPVPEAKAEAEFKKKLKESGMPYEKFKDTLKKRLLMRKFIMDSIRQKVVPPTDPEIKAYFGKVESVINGSTEALKGLDADDAQALAAVAQEIKTMTAERVHVRHILFKTDKAMPIVEKNAKKQAAEQALKEIKGGADFRELAMKLSDDKESAARGGDIGNIVRGMMPKPFEDAVFKLEVGETGGPVETDFGYHIVRVEEKRAQQEVSFDDVKNQLGQFMTNQRMNKEALAMIKELRGKAAVTVN